MGQGHYQSRRLCEPCHVTFVSNPPLVLGRRALRRIARQTGSRDTVKVIDPGRATVGAQRTRRRPGRRGLSPETQRRRSAPCDFPGFAGRDNRLSFARPSGRCETRFPGEAGFRVVPPALFSPHRRTGGRSNIIRRTAQVERHLAGDAGGERHHHATHRPRRESAELVPSNAQTSELESAA